MKNIFRRIAQIVSAMAGSAWAFVLAVFIVLLWALSGPVFDYSNTWQLIINTTTTIATFLMVFLIQNTQTRDAKAMQLKLDELIRATRARDSFMDIEDLSDDDLAHISDELRRVHEQTGHPAIKKFHAKVEAAHHHRTKHGIEGMADQVVNMIESFGVHNDDKKSKK